ncbi:MAG: hypothetical protein U9P00_10415, partial [Pseudomonadota bacterium]|nr:hypothetical protein [Pseudomonadota bacterium]
PDERCVGQKPGHVASSCRNRGAIIRRRSGPGDFRLALRTGSWGAKDLRYLLPALLPERLYLALIGLAERGKAQD